MPLSTKYKSDYFQIVILLCLIIVTGVLHAEDVENIYQYKNSEGVTEFTDTVKENEVPVNQIKIQKMTEEEKAQGKERLDQIEQENKELDQRIEAQRQLEKEQNIQRQKDRAEKKQQQEEFDESEDIQYYNNGTIRNRPIRPHPLRPKRPINRPVQPRPVQLPARGK